MRITHIGITVRDVEKSVEFYTNVMGLEEVRRVTSRQGKTLVFLKGEGDTMIELIPGFEGSAGQGETSEGFIRHVAFEVPDIAASGRALNEKGVSLTWGPIEGIGGTKIAFFEDPDGIELEFVQEGRPEGVRRKLAERTS
jgi:lactoylglutathione lyase